MNKNECVYLVRRLSECLARTMLTWISISVHFLCYAVDCEKISSSAYNRGRKAQESRRRTRRAERKRLPT